MARLQDGRIDWRARFNTFVISKEREASEAKLSRFTTASDAGDSLTPIGNAWSRALFDGSFYVSEPSADLPACSLVFVQSRDGNTGAKDPSMLGGGESDKHLIYEGLSRVAANGVLAGAETIRGGDVVFSVWHPAIVALRTSLGLPRHPIQIVATLGGLALDDTLLYNVPELHVVVLTVPECAELMHERLADRPWITPVRMARPDDLPSACRALRRMGIERVSCVGGRTVATALLDAGLIRDLYLTTSPRPGGQPNTPLYPRPLATRTVVRKYGTGRETGVVFEHLSLSKMENVRM
jgi:5-amino-6-(5-phosphoribosylamino)uracil reductase